jgi:hypothetical protein
MDDILIARAIDWDTGVNTGTSKPDDNATVGATAGTDLKKSSGSVLSDSQVITNMGTAANTSKIDDTTSTSGHDANLYADLNLNSGADINFYSGDGTGGSGSIYADSTGLAVTSSHSLYLTTNNGAHMQLDADSTLSLVANGCITFDSGIGNLIRVKQHLGPYNNGIQRCGTSTNRWLEVNCNGLDVNGDGDISGDLTISGDISATGGDVFLGTSTNYFVLHRYSGGTWVAENAYINMTV